VRNSAGLHGARSSSRSGTATTSMARRCYNNPPGRNTEQRRAQRRGCRGGGVSCSATQTAPVARRGFLVLQPGGSWTGPPVPAAKGAASAPPWAPAPLPPFLLLPPSLFPSLVAATGIERETQAAAEQGDAAGMGFKRAVG
jgi:hypothetical protein